MAMTIGFGNTDVGIDAGRSSGGILGGIGAYMAGGDPGVGGFFKALGNPDYYYGRAAQNEALQRLKDVSQQTAQDHETMLSGLREATPEGRDRALGAFDSMLKVYQDAGLKTEPLYEEFRFATTQSLANKAAGVDLNQPNAYAELGKSSSGVDQSANLRQSMDAQATSTSQNAYRDEERRQLERAADVNQQQKEANRDLTRAQVGTQGTTQALQGAEAGTQATTQALQRSQAEQNAAQTAGITAKNKFFDKNQYYPGTQDLSPGPKPSSPLNATSTVMKIMQGKPGGFGGGNENYSMGEAISLGESQNAAARDYDQTHGTTSPRVVVEPIEGAVKPGEKNYRAYSVDNEEQYQKIIRRMQSNADEPTPGQGKPPPPSAAPTPRDIPIDEAMRRYGQGENINIGEGVLSAQQTRAIQDMRRQMDQDLERTPASQREERKRQFDNQIKSMLRTYLGGNVSGNAQ